MSFGSFHGYTATWLLLVFIAIALVLRQPRRYAFLSTDYLEFLARPWKLVTFVVALVAMNAIGPFSGDPTWDAFTATFMSFAAFLTAPWVVGVLWRIPTHRDPRQVFVALVLGLFGWSWSYDLYLWLRDGVYPFTWWANLGASGWLYTSAGVFWSLTTTEDRTDLAFRRDPWPDPTPERRLGPIVVVGAVVALPVAIALLSFLFTTGVFAR